MATTLLFPADPRWLYTARAVVAASTRLPHMPVDRIDDLVLATSEALSGLLQLTDGDRLRLSTDTVDGQSEIEVRSLGGAAEPLDEERWERSLSGLVVGALAARVAVSSGPEGVAIHMSFRV